MGIIDRLFLWILYASLTASILALFIILIKSIFNGRIGPRFHHALWLIVLIRLLVPVVPESPLSVLNLLPEKFHDAIDSGNSTVLDAPAFLTEEHNYNNSNEANSYKNYSRNDHTADNGFSFEEYSNKQEKEAIIRRALRIASLTWLAGFLSIALFTITAVLRLKNKTISYKKLEESQITSVLEDCLDKLKIKNNISVYTGENLRSPCISGTINTRIYLPEGICSKVDRNQLMHVILHELAHHKRKDAVYNLLGTIAAMIHWFNPIVWFATKRMKLLREIACDAYVLETLGEEEKISYGMTIIDLSRLFQNNNKQLSLLSFFKTKNQIERRIDMIKAFRKGSYKISIAAVICCILIGSATLTNAVSSSSIANSNVNDTLSTESNKDSAPEIKFLIDAPIKSYNDINKVVKIADFKFKVPDFAPSGCSPSAFHMIKASEEADIIKIFFDNETEKKLGFTFQASAEDLKKLLIENAKNEFTSNENIQSEIDSTEEPFSYGSLKGLNLTITTRTTADESHWEIRRKFFLWQDEDIWYGIECTRDIKTSKGTTNIITDLPQENVKKIAESVKYLGYVKNMNYASIPPEISTEISQLSIYDKEDLDKAKTLLGFPIKFPLTIPGNIKVLDASVGISYDSDIKNNKINYELVVIYNSGQSSLTFVQRENSIIYDYAKEKGYFELNNGEANKTNRIKTELLVIDGKDILRYENTYDGKTYGTNYIWKENGSYCTVYFSSETENREEILKSLINENIIDSKASL